MVSDNLNELWRVKVKIQFLISYLIVDHYPSYPEIWWRQGDRKQEAYIVYIYKYTKKFYFFYFWLRWLSYYYYNHEIGFINLRFNDYYYYYFLFLFNLDVITTT